MAIRRSVMWVGVSVYDHRLIRTYMYAGTLTCIGAKLSYYCVLCV